MITIDSNAKTVSQNLNSPDSSKEVKNVFNKEKAREIKLHQKCKDLEGLFITQLFKAMEKTIPKSSLVGSKNTLSSMMFSSVMGEALANQGGFGLADVIFKSLKDKDEIINLDKLSNGNFIDNIQAIGTIRDIDNE